MYKIELKFHPQTLFIQESFVEGGKRYGIHPSTLATLVNTYQTAIQQVVQADTEDLQEKLIQQFQQEGFLILTELDGDEVQDLGITFQLSFIYSVETDPQTYFRIIEKEDLIQPVSIETISFIN